ncbi:hypothetical protein MCAP1_003318 [Malassezia caprae]|uniref:Pinin/SDK/MemA protein domain-containing protein n=1 Tax=Malassezia caprae TaxID=1381934 RepID=A0AAF0EEH5_9BASI|nr:hypothetical protein MCAP1_003318 [Malassezia caprae]
MEPVQPDGDAAAADTAPSRTDAVPALEPMEQDASGRPGHAAVDRQRHRRMMGLLHSTLAQASTRPRARTRAPAREGASGSERVADQASMAEERRAHDAERAMVRRDVQRVHELAEKLAAHEAAHRAARASKRRLSSFLVTHTTRRPSVRAPRDAAETAATQAARIVPSVPLGSGAPDDYEIYYLPRTLLPAQEDELDEQEELVDAEMERADDEWDRLRDALQAELREIQQRLAQHHVQW